MDYKTLRYLVAGRLTRDYVILPSGDVLLDTPGGNVLYAAAGLALWDADPPPGVLARVGEDYPQEWLSMFTQNGLDMRGVRILPEALDVRSFIAFKDLGAHPDTSTSPRLNDDPVMHFARLSLPFPKSLLGYRLETQPLDSRTRLSATSLRQEDIPEYYLDAHIAHICPMDYLSHSLLPAVFRQAQFTTVTLDPSAGYMNPTYWNDVPALLTGLTAFLPSEQEIRSLFHGRSDDLWEMAETLAAYGCEFIVIKCGERGQLLFDSAARVRWEVPSYPARVVNPLGAGDAFCGGFLAGYHLTFDPLMAVLHGNISASLVIEGNEPFYMLECLPGLPQARLEALRSSARRL